MLDLISDKEALLKIINKRKAQVSFLTSTSVVSLLSACGGGSAPSPSNDDNLNSDVNTDDVDLIPSLQSLAHDVSGTTHFNNLSNLVTDPYEGYPTFINGDFDFTNLEIDYSKLEFSSKPGPKYDQTDGYTGMVYYGNFGDVTGDGKPDMVISGWTVDTGNASGRIFLLELDPQNGITNVEWTDNEGTAAPWVEDFDGDGIAEIMSIGFYDFPVAPAPTIYFDGGLENGVSVGPAIDSHESSVVDYDGDGDLDVVAISYNSVNGLISLFRNNGNGFDHEYLPTDQSSYFASGSSIEYADLDGDGLGEFIVGDFAGDGGIAILKLNEDGTFLNSSEWRNVLEIRPYFESEDFDGIDSIFTSDNPNASDEQIAKARSHDIVLKAIDVDGDGDLDVLNSTAVWNNTTPFGVIQFLINDGVGNFTDETDQRLFNYSLTASASHDLVFKDMNNDGFFDILIPENGASTVTYENAQEKLSLGMLSEGNTILINDGTGHFLNIMFGPFSQAGTYKAAGESYPNKWYPMLHNDGTLGFVHVGKGWENGLNSEYDLFNYAHFEQTLYTGPAFVNPAEYGAPGFNEFYVLRTNPDVQELVKTGVYGSALEWYLETNPSDFETFAKHAKVVGSESDDVIHLRDGNEVALAGNGNDTIYVYDGNDTVTTGNGSDIIVISGTAGKQNQNSIKDFSLIGGDKLDLSAFGVISEAQALELTTQIAAGSLITLTEDASVMLEGVQVTELSAADGWII